MKMRLHIVAVLAFWHNAEAVFRIIYPQPWAPLLSNSITYHNEDPTSLENMQIAQFHSQDAAGRYVFGFNTPDQARVEARSHDGKVRGSYSYLDPFGRTVKMEYWDNGHGFHMAEPKDGSHAFNVYTPEVQAARDLHFQLYKQAAEAAAAALESPFSNGGSDSSDMMDHNTGYDDGKYHHSYDEHMDTTDDDSPSSFPSSHQDDSPYYPYGHDNQHDTFKNSDEMNEYGKNQEFHDDEKESIAIDSAEFKNSISGRSGKSTTSEGESPIDRKDTGDDVSLNQSAQSNEDNIKVYVVPEQATGTIVESSVGKNGFFYQFQHPVPIQPLVDAFNTVPSSAPESLHASLYGAIPIDAVHDSQVAPHQLPQIQNHQLKPLFMTVPKKQAKLLN